MGTNKKYTIEDMQKLAEAKGGKCLSSSGEYKNVQSILEWQCYKGHIWKNRAFNIIYASNGVKSSWCSTCSKKKKHTIEEVHELAKAKGGKCLSTIYINGNTKLQFECHKEHKFELRTSNLVQGQWCRTCGNISSGLKRLTSFEKIKELIEERGYILLSTKYSSQESLEIKCPLNHIFNATLNSFKNQKRGCSICSKSKHVSENICRLYFETIFKRKFPTIKPKWLINSRGNQMELDGYSEELSIAFEYQGEQHYQLGRGFFRKNGQELTQRVEDDKQKVLLCNDNKVKLFVIKYDIPYKEIPEEIKLQSKNLSLDILKYNFDVRIDLTKASVLNRIEDLKELAKSKELECLSNYYLNGQTLLKFKCKNNHIFEMKASRIKDKRISNFCIECFKGKAGFNVKYSLQEMKNLAESKKGLFLSLEYKGGKVDHEWQCEVGHTWFTKPAQILNGSWCRICHEESLKSEKQLIAKQMYEEGINITFIAERLETFDGTITMWAKKYSWKRIKEPNRIHKKHHAIDLINDARKLYENGASDKEIASILKISNVTIPRWAKEYNWVRVISITNWSNGQAYSEIILSEAKKMYEDGIQKKSILSKLGINHYSTLDHWIKKYNWQRSKDTKQLSLEFD